MDAKEHVVLDDAFADRQKAAVVSKSNQALQDIAFGSVGTSTPSRRSTLTTPQIAGVLGKYIEYPFDTVKVRLQSQPQGVQLYTGPLDCFRQSVSRNGLWSLYRGISAPLFGAAVETSSLFFSVGSSHLHDPDIC